MQASEIVARARWYALYEHASPAEALLSVLIALFTDEDVAHLSARSLQQAWERLTRARPLADCLQESRVFADGIDVLAANLAEAERRDLAATLRQVGQLRIAGAARSEAAVVQRPGRRDDVPVRQGDGRRLLPQGASLLGFSG